MGTGCELLQHARRADDCFALYCNTVLRALLQHGTRPVHEEPSQVAVSPFADAQELLFAAGGAFAGTIPNQAANCRPLVKAAPLPIAAMTAVAVIDPTPGIANRRRQASFCPAVCLRAASAWLTHWFRSSSSNFSCASSSRLTPDNRTSASFQNPGQCGLYVAPPLPHRYAAFQEQSTNLVDYRGTACHTALTHAMDRLQVQLIIAPDWHETHPRASHGLGDRFCIDIVILVGLYIRLHVLRRHHSYLVSLFAQDPAQKMRSR